MSNRKSKAEIKNVSGNAAKLPVIGSALPKSHTKFIIDAGAGLGEYITTGTQILLQLSLAADTYEQLRILDGVLEKLGIEPEDFNRLRRNDIKALKLIEGQDEKYSFE